LFIRLALWIAAEFFSYLSRISNFHSIELQKWVWSSYYSWNHEGVSQKILFKNVLRKSLFLPSLLISGIIVAQRK